MIYLLITIFCVQAIITLKLFLSIDSAEKSKVKRTIKLSVLFVVSVGIFILISSYMLTADAFQ